MSIILVSFPWPILPTKYTFWGQQCVAIHSQWRIPSPTIFYNDPLISRNSGCLVLTGYLLLFRCWMRGILLSNLFNSSLIALVDSPNSSSSSWGKPYFYRSVRQQFDFVLEETSFNHYWVEIYCFKIGKKRIITRWRPKKLFNYLIFKCLYLY